jgi:hypothetical protein
MANAKVVVGVKYVGTARQVVCIPDGVGIHTDPNKGPQLIEWEFDGSIPAEVTGAEIRFLGFQPKTYPTKQPIPSDMILTGFGAIGEKPPSQGLHLRNRVTTANPKKKGYFFYQINLLAGDVIWATTDPGGVNEGDEAPLPWPPLYP